ncbi:MAG: PEP/pyruvate-binding domain-containing protein [Mariniblastus sp.]|nr:PEP/pyruvate-binding domain-containing protein [Mariniblastus sp.]
MKASFFILVICAVCFATDFAQAQPGRRGGPVGPRIEPENLDFDLGVGKIPDRELFEKLSYQGPEVSRDAYLANLEFVKFIIDKADPNNHKVYFMNTQNHRAHPPYMRLVGIESRERGAITYMPRLTSPDGTPGLYIIDFQPNDSYSFEDIDRILKKLTDHMPLLKGKVAFHPLGGNMRRYESEKDKYENGGVSVYLDSDIYKNISYLPLNIAKGFGKLRVYDNELRSSPRDILICPTLPNEMPRVAGVITEARQTPLSHVNLRAIQDKVPNAFIKDARQLEDISSLIGKEVFYEVTSQGYRIRLAKPAEIERHFAAMRPTVARYPKRDLSSKKIIPLEKADFVDASRYGAKAANLAAMKKFKLKKGTLPDGFVMPFYFYDEFMKHNGLYKAFDKLAENEQFKTDSKFRAESLAKFQSQIRTAEMPAWMMEQISALQKEFPADTPIRCRSSTNNEDLDGFSGAGLYDSFTHNPSEGHLAKSVKQVFASLWNFRAYEERAFFLIDHKQTAMGVLFHPNFKGELANGVAVTSDVLYGTEGNYYLNIQPEEDLVTNPTAESSPEETLLAWWERDGQQIIRSSNPDEPANSLLDSDQQNLLREALGRIHFNFEKLYGKNEGDEFAMEIEFKITSDGKLVIKQARPWVF